MTRSHEALVDRRADGRWVLSAPEVGLWREGPSLGRVLRPFEPLGRIEILGVLRPVHVPAGVAGLVVERLSGDCARSPVGYGSPLVVLDPEGASAVAEQQASFEAAPASDGLVLRAPMGGRFYGRPSPTKPAFVEVGDLIEEGQTVALVEVMKTFNRILYGSPDLPKRARVKRLLVEDDSDIAAGDPILEVEPS